MPNSRQAKKRMRQDDKRRLINRSKSSAMKTAMRRVTDAVAEGGPRRAGEAFAFKQQCGIFGRRYAACSARDGAT